MEQTTAAAPVQGISTELDPFTFQIIRHRLFRITEEALIALGKVSGTPAAAEGHDVLVALYRADGSVLLAGLGFLHHMLAAAQAVKHIIRSFSEDPGIFEGDMFMANDPYTVAMHAPDVFMIAPIHVDGRLVGWVVNYVHVTDIGGQEIGGACPAARECFHEGFSTQGLKLVERGKIRKDVFETFLNMIRDPGMTGLDLKSQMAANHVAKQRLQSLCVDYGIEAVDAVAATLIDQAEQGLRRRLCELPDGTWRARHYLDLPDHTYRFELAATKEDDRLVYDFAGTDPQAPQPINCQYWAAKGAALAPVFPLLAWDLTWNEGIVRCFDVIAPEGSLVNCKRPAPVSIATIASVHVVNVMSNVVLSRMLGASRRYHDRAVGGWLGTVAACALGGVNRFGEFVGQVGGDVFGMGEGARSFMDGATSGGHIVNVAQKFPNAEFEEQAFPKLLLHRRIVPDSGGPGKFRGGACHEHAIAFHGGLGDSMVAVLVPGKGKDFLGGQGVFGGYPSIHTDHLVYRSANVAELPDSGAAITAQAVEDVRARAVQVGTSDIVFLRPDGGGGYGDPLDRDPQLVAVDVRDGIVSKGAARDVYGVVFDRGAVAVDAPETARQRLAIRERRIERPLRAPFETRRGVPRSSRRIGEYLQVAGEGAAAFVQCTWCGERICEASADWKDHAVTRRSAPSVAGPHRRDDGGFLLREFFCPGCATALEVEVIGKDDPPLHDRIIRWP